MKTAVEQIKNNVTWKFPYSMMHPCSVRNLYVRLWLYANASRLNHASTGLIGYSEGMVDIPLPAPCLLRGFARPEKNSGPAAGRFTNRPPSKGGI